MFRLSKWLQQAADLFFKLPHRLPKRFTHPWTCMLLSILCYWGCGQVFHLILSRQMDKVEHQRVQVTISNDQKMKEMKQEGEKKVSQVKQQLKEEQTKLKWREEEIDKLKRYVLSCR